MAQARSQSARPSSGYWRPAHAYVLAIVTLLLGIAVGYLVRGIEAENANSRSSTPVGTNISPAPVPAISGQTQVAGVEPLLRELQTAPNDPELLARVGNAYYAAQNYSQAVQYYQRSLSLRPADVNVRTDMATAVWYTGDADGALREFEQSLKYQPNHAQTLFNLGMVRWQGKKDAKGALQAWEKLLATNPNYPERQKVQDLIQQVRSGR
jgi:cytochrome c-type biogenesis protein CcmH/NrfG